jgi:hypothetical protein
MNLDRYAEFIGEFLQLAFPQTHARTIAAAAISGNEQTPLKWTPFVGPRTAGIKV